MRPLVLDPLFRSIRTLPGVGPAVAKKLAQLIGGERVLDLLWHKPIETIDRRPAPDLAHAVAGQTVTIKLVVDKVSLPSKRGLPARIRCRQGLLFLDIVYFNHVGDWLAKTFHVGAEIAVSGRLERYQDSWQMVHPDLVGGVDAFESFRRIEPVYPLTAGIGQKILMARIEQALKTIPMLPEWLDETLIKQRGWLPWHQSIRALHVPENIQDIEPNQPYRQRLAYDELLARQMALLLVRGREKHQSGRSFPMQSGWRDKFLSLLPFTLTKAQQEVLVEVDKDMASTSRMIRLVQGDVGSGKTVVAFAAMLTAAANGVQAAIMAPTELLAKQHFETMQPWAKALGIGIALLTGRQKSMRADVADGQARIVIGTHALFQESVQFKDLGLVVIDEQHRFGVEQRLRLAAKGNSPDLLVMTATPIPRTLTLAMYGDMDVSLIRQKPEGRQKVDTRIVSGERMGEVINGLKRALSQGQQAYWVCPLVSETELSDMAAAEQRQAELTQHFGAQVGLLHGQMKPAEKDKMAEKFASGEIRLLVATTVIEVGINVPNASIMVIEHAERFGLSQLHQLRGRVGRGTQKSSCILLYHHPVSEMARQRLQALRDTDDGFVIAEQDLALRGAGEMLGTAQSGLPRYRLADAEEHAGFIDLAHRDAQLALSRDPQLQSARGAALRVLLYLFEQDAAYLTLQSG